MGVTQTNTNKMEKENWNEEGGKRKNFKESKKRAYAIQKRNDQREAEFERQANRKAEESRKKQQEEDEKKIIFKKVSKEEKKKMQEEDDELCKPKQKGCGKRK